MNPRSCSNKVRRQKLLKHTALYTACALLSIHRIKKNKLYSAYCSRLQDRIRISHTRKSNPLRRKRLNWQHFCGLVSDTHFRRMFRMTRSCFQDLCDRIKARVGEASFCSQHYIDTELETGNSQQARMYKAHKHTSGGYVCGEVKLALTLRMLAGGSYLDISHIFCVKDKQVYPIFHRVLREWICNDDISRYKLQDILDDEDEMYEISKHFAAGRSGGVLAGVIGAVDGWLVKIECPKGVPNPGGYYSRKGFYALNVQVIVDKKKRILSMYVGAKGGEHDSAAFKASSMYQNLEKRCLDPNAKIHNNRFNIPFYLVGDSAYSLRPFLMVPYDNALPNSPEDMYNYIHSSSRIYVECAFGEIDARWGIFWRPLKFDLEEHKFVIDACMRLHNFIIEHKENRKEVDDDEDFYSKDCLQFLTVHPEEVVGVYGNGALGVDPSSRRGRPTLIMQRMRDAGVRIRDNLRDKMSKNNLVRPQSNGWYVDSCHHTRLRGMKN